MKKCLSVRLNECEFIKKKIDFAVIYLLLLKKLETILCDQMSFYSIIARALNDWKVIDVVLQIYFVMPILKR